MRTSFQFGMNCQGFHAAILSWPAYVYGRKLENSSVCKDILYKHQYDFRQHYSTIHPILHLLNDISNANDNKSKDITLAIFLDMSKAFDTISHDILIRKLEHYGIRGTCKDWFASYLTNRFQYTEIHGNNQPI